MHRNGVRFLTSGPKSCRRSSRTHLSRTYQPTTDSGEERDDADADARTGAVDAAADEYADADADAAVPALPFPGLVRTAMPAGSLAQAYCEVAYGPSGKVRMMALISVPRVCQRDNLPFPRLSVSSISHAVQLSMIY